MLIKLLRTKLKPYTGLLILVVLLQLLGTLAALLLPSLNASIIDKGVATGDTPYIWRTGLLMLGVSLVQVICTIGAVWAGARAAMSFGRDTRAALFDRIMSFSTREVDHFGAPSLITRNTNDVQQVQMLVVMTCTLLVTAPLTMIGGIIMALREDVGLSAIIAVAIPVLALVIGVVIWKMGPMFAALQTKIDALNRVLREQITGIRVVRAFVREPEEKARFDATNSELTSVNTRVGQVMAGMFPIVFLIVNLSSVAVVWFGASRIDAGDLQVGQLTAFLTYLVQILMSVMMASMMFMMVPRAAVCADRIQEVLDTESSVHPPLHGVTELPAKGLVEFENVSFAYPGAEEPVLHDITFTARPGEFTAIIGSTGAGKSTLLNLIPRLFDATDGIVRFDGVDVREVDPDALWQRLGLVPQKSFLFTGSIASNLRQGNEDATDEELWEALRTAQAADFVTELDEQLEAPVAQGGTNFSGGQRQRLAIARALVRQPEVLLFDDSFSALDVATDARLRAALSRAEADTTMIIVAQRVSTIRNADQILVLDDGRIVGSGRHEDLLASCPTYQEIVDSQLSAEEAA